MSNLCLCSELAGPNVALHFGCFGQVWLFEGMPPEAWNGVSRYLVRKNLSAGEDLFRQGDHADSMYLIKMGSVKLWKITEEGRILTLDIRKAGDLLGESVLLEQGEYPVGATCLEHTLTCGIDRSVFESLVVRYPTIGLVVIRNLSRRIQHLSEKVGALSEPNLDDRLYEVLVNVAREMGTRVPGGWTIAFPLTHEEIGFLVGAHRVSVTRTIGKLRDVGKIRTDGKSLFISDLAAIG
jgi:CRP/FNR family cyclic AMP-dependent transcriptional regulator